MRVTVLEQESLGGAVFQYPRGKLVMTSPVDLPLVGRVRFTNTSKEKLLEFWQHTEQRLGLRFNYQERVLGIEALEQGGFRVRTSRGEHLAGSVLLAIGRRGTPRKLGVPGEDLPKVVYRLIDPEQYRDQKVLIVGGGDSALEAAASIAEAGGTVYRGWSPLLVAVSRDDAAEVRRRLAAGDDPGARTPQGATALRVAVESNAALAAAALLAAGADPHRKEADGLDTRQHVVRFGTPALFEVFFPADVKLRAPETQTLTVFAIERGDAALLRALLARGAEARTAGAQGTGPLHLAARRGDVAMVKLLLEHGADANAADVRGRSALWHAAAARSPAALDLLLSAGADAGAADQEGVTPLMLAVRAADEASVKRLLASEAARNARLLESPLRIAASLGQGAIVELLLSRRVAVDAADEFGDTALMAAARAGHGDICQRLLAAGANARLRNRDRTTAADLAEARGFHALAGRLKS